RGVALLGCWLFTRCQQQDFVQRGAFTTPCPRRNAAPRPLVYKSRKLPRRGVPTGAGRPGAIAATCPGISAGAGLRGGAAKAATARGPAIPEAKSLIRARDGGAGRATRRRGR